MPPRAAVPTARGFSFNLCTTTMNNDALRRAVCLITPLPLVREVDERPRVAKRSAPDPGIRLQGLTQATPDHRLEVIGYVVPDLRTAASTPTRSSRVYLWPDTGYSTHLPLRGPRVHRHLFETDDFRRPGLLCLMARRMATNS